MADPRTAYQRGRILAAIENEALTAGQLAERLHLTRDGINIHLKAMKEARPKLIYVAGHLYNPEGGRPAPQYRPGNAKDAEYVKTRAAVRQGRPQVVDVTTERVIELLSRTPMTAHELGAALSLTSSRARWYISQLRAESPKRVHVKRYQANFASYPSPVYAAGDKPDAVYQCKTRKELYREAMRDPDRRERVLRKGRLRHMIATMRKKPVSWFAALPGAQSLAMKEAA
jgi:predicted ArsR family transcriptional regulator